MNSSDSCVPLLDTSTSKPSLTVTLTTTEAEQGAASEPLKAPEVKPMASLVVPPASVNRKTDNQQENSSTELQDDSIQQKGKQDYMERRGALNDNVTSVKLEIIQRQVDRLSFHDVDNKEVKKSKNNNKAVDYKATHLMGMNQKPTYLAGKQYVILDVGGERFVARRKHLMRYPSTRLGRLVACEIVKDILLHCDEFIPGDPPEYFFDKNPDGFAAILEMYRTGIFHVPEVNKSCSLVFRKVLEYWDVDELAMEPCCALKFYPLLEICTNEKDGDTLEKRKEIALALEENFGPSIWGRTRTYLWRLTEYPETSRAAQIYAVFTLIVVLISTITFVISTFEEDFKELYDEEEFEQVLTIINIIDVVVVVFFTLEYLIRFSCSPAKLRFFKDAMNLIDFLSLIPFYIAILLEGLEDYEIIGKAGKILRLLKVMRILRIYKLFRHFAGLQSLLYTLQQAYRELGLLFIVIAIAILIFASLVYFAEKIHDNPIVGYTVLGHQDVNNTWTFVESFWWSLMTITTVGYDLNPSTGFGRVLGGFCALMGVFTLTLPIPIVVNSFASYYKNRLWRNEVAQKKRERIRAETHTARRLQEEAVKLAAQILPEGCELFPLDSDTKESAMSVLSNIRRFGMDNIDDMPAFAESFLKK